MYQATAFLGVNRVRDSRRGGGRDQVVCGKYKYQEGLHGPSILQKYFPSHLDMIRTSVSPVVRLTCTAASRSLSTLALTHSRRLLLPNLDKKFVSCRQLSTTPPRENDALNKVPSQKEATPVHRRMSLAAYFFFLPYLTFSILRCRGEYWFFVDAYFAIN